MSGVLFWSSLAIAVTGAVVAGRVLFLAWKAAYHGPDRRSGDDRRQTTMPVPMERRRRRERRD
ncbi:MAG: hypothetical protein V2I67_17190 [Thermoanaerobaculales bacterium]|jgi:hypothetical protein|nr:hypothetical protein [Thermoanaerobaculales bacterium]